MSNVKLFFGQSQPSDTQIRIVTAVNPNCESDELVAAATSSLGFWDNPIDDEDWNDA
jgi:hypothetical protein